MPSKVAFLPSHRVTYSRTDGSTADYFVDLCSDYYAYAEDEVDADSADWKVVDGRWLFRGQPAPDDAMSEVLITTILPVHLDTSALTVPSQIVNAAIERSIGERGTQVLVPYDETVASLLRELCGREYEREFWGRDTAGKCWRVALLSMSP